MRKIDNHGYLLPWNEGDNPNGWMEPTTYCQLKCPGCYRGLDKDDHIAYHVDFKELSQQVDWFIKNRNIQTISIAGGEPLLYPQLNDLVKYCNEKDLRVMVYSNGVALNKEKLVELKNSGVTQIVLHVDRYQERPDLDSGKTIDDLRAHFCDLFREVGGIHLGFIQPISTDYVKEVDRMKEFAKENIDVINLVVFSLYQEICWNDQTKESINTSINIDTITDRLELVDDFEPGAYLPSEQNLNDITWLFGIKFGLPNFTVGYFSSQLYKKVHERYRRRNGRSLFISRHNRIIPLKLVKYIFVKSVFKLLFKFVSARLLGKLKTREMYLQTVLVLRGPIKKGDKWDLCQSCPDRMIYKGKLIPSCILEDLRNGENSKYKEVAF